jgi:hypothetical protein
MGDVTTFSGGSVMKRTTIFLASVLLVNVLTGVCLAACKDKQLAPAEPCPFIALSSCNGFSQTECPGKEAIVSINTAQFSSVPNPGTQVALTGGLLLCYSYKQCFWNSTLQLCEPGLNTYPSYVTSRDTEICPT